MNELEYKKILWHSRRGMLELDLLLVPFVTAGFAPLSASLQDQYRLLLEHEDQEIFAWLVLGEPPAAGLTDIVGAILEFAAGQH
jgi:antitoxin CptB